MAALTAALVVCLAWAAARGEGAGSAGTDDAALRATGASARPAGRGAHTGGSAGADDAAGPALGKPPRTTVDFARDVQPILEQHCYECHGPTKARGRLRLDTRRRALEGGMTGPSLVAGDSENSLLVRRLLGLDGEDRMPLEKPPLHDDQIALIRGWIDQGATWPDASDTTEQSDEPVHWAYVKPTRPDPPAVVEAAWPRNPIDRFILARLEREGLTPSPEATREALIRRVSLDLTGLPPTLEQVDAFLADARPDAYDRLVDALLASPHYGERWARPWLDLARYADSHGYEKDGPRTMWKYRDWVIGALNQDMPFDQFTIEQIAGDMLPGATDAQRVASGFHRNTLLNQEGGIDVEEARWETLVDRVNTTATVWLGTTLACAQCHNHKYDPFSQRDYYRMLAFFDNVEYSVGGQSGGDRWIHEPQLDLPTPDQAKQRAELQARIDALRKELEDDSPAARDAQGRWEQSFAEAERHWTPLTPSAVRAANGTRLAVQHDAAVLASGPAPIEEQYIVTVRLPAGRVTGFRIEALPDPSLPQGGPGRDYYGNFVVTAFTVDVPSAGGSVRFDNAGADDAVWNNDVTQLVKPYAGAARNRDLPPGWAIDATRDERRMRRQAVLVPATPLELPAGATATITLASRGIASSQAIGRFRLSVTAHADPLFVVSIPVKTRAVLELDPDARTDEQRTALAGQFRARAPALEPVRAQIAELERQIADLGIVTALVMKEKPSHERPSTPFRERGSYLSPAGKVYAGTPEILPPLPDDAMPNRLGLARWLVHEGNPLTARVAVNRAWEQFFGVGIVETSEDFGTQAREPSHPDLLDWLATEFVRLGWSQKALHRLIVTSAAYRQSAAAPPALLERDPANRLLARGPRFRMEAEMIRDTALAVSGLLSRKIGGPSVFPPQPDGIWDNPYSDQKWVTSTGENRYRRALYTFTRRTSPYPSLITFDATSREFCTVRRVRTNTPLQALVTLNDEAFFEAARALAGRMLAEVDAGRAASGSSAADLTRARAARGFRLCTSRRPTDAEVDRIVRSFEAQREKFLKDPGSAARVAGASAGADAADRAAWTMVANALLNLDETLAK